MGEIASASIAGPRVFTSVVDPGSSYDCGGSNVGSVSHRSPAYSSTAVGPPRNVIAVAIR